MARRLTLVMLVVLVLVAVAALVGVAAFGDDRSTPHPADAVAVHASAPRTAPTPDGRAPARTPLLVAVFVLTLVVASSRRAVARGDRRRVGCSDVGDGWRALLVGAPPALV